MHSLLFYILPYLSHHIHSINVLQPLPSSLGPRNPSGGIGDFALFVDDDGTAYNILTHGIDGPGHRDMCVAYWTVCLNHALGGALAVLSVLSDGVGWCPRSLDFV